MLRGQFCFLAAQYYQDFPDDKLMRNREIINGISYKRPCFFAFPDIENPQIFWLVPVSSKENKYRAIAQKKIEKYGKCNTICFGELLEKQAAFLIQNICPVTKQYIQEIYLDRKNSPIQTDNRVVNDVIRNAREVLAKVRKGAKIVYPDIMAIYNELSKQLLQDEST